MTRQSAATDAAINGIVGIAVLSAGTLSASVVAIMLNPWLTAIPALLIWATFAFYGFKQFAYGLHTVVGDATRK
ncbi:hypothetical protein SAMN05421858_3828 [Haladaptatus litoreus]|uniref:Uncharacterized protein n=1 Tax=Haladaptatus litoreus TaxID=553468 RepID=A0A1N7DXG5_9EURY|nr:hypothetical protein [Haladaptatus litoreus]SIR80466.1 hypothetical protein SAMN05421858_3828 [Haladaptatus litoreus]